MRFFKTVLFFLISLTVFGQINEGKLLELEFQQGSNPKNISSGTNKMYLSAENGYSGRELYVYDKVLDSIQMVKDIQPGSQSSISDNEESFMCIGDDLFFVALNQLWKSDGTETGTTMVKDINPSGDSYIDNFTIFNGILYFTARDDTNSYRLWRSDGTVTGTTFLEIPQGPNGTQIYGLTVFDNHLYFNANDGVNGYELWRSDGTPTGTIRLTTLNGNQNGVFPYSKPLEFNNHLYFYANDGIHGFELWRTNGTETGTQLFKDIQSGTSDSAVTLNGVATDDYFVFMASGPSSLSYEPWVSDGTVEGTNLLKDINPSTSSINLETNFIAFEGDVFFIANDGVHGKELWKTNGTEAGTELFIDFISGSNGNSVNALTATSDFLIFSAQTLPTNEKTLWISDGTVSGTQEFNEIDMYNTSANELEFVEFNQGVYFQAGYNSESGMELWSTDGTNTNTGLFRDIRRERGINPEHYSVLNNKLVFVGNSYDNGKELYVSNGTNQGTHLIKDINEGGASSMNLFTENIKAFMNVNEVLYFTATEPVHGLEVYRTDGTEQGTYILKDIAPGSTGSQSLWTFFASMGDLLFFKANDGVHGDELWVSDGTEVGTQMLKDIYPGIGSGFEISNIYKHYDGYAVLNDELYFSAFDGNDYAIWKTDGTESGTVPIIEIPSSGPLDRGPLVFSGDDEKFYFGINHNNSFVRVNEVWVTDGTQQNSTIVYSTPSNNSIRETYVFNGDLYFSAFSDEIGTTLFKSDGTQDSAIVLSEEISLLDNLYNYNFGFFLECSGYLFFYSIRDNQLWRTDGTAEGTIVVADYSDPPSTPVLDMICYEDLVLYIDNLFSKTIKVSNGLDLNFEHQVELMNDHLFSETEGLTSLAATNDLLFFTAFTQREGLEIYMTAGEPSMSIIDYYTFLNRKKSIFNIFPNPANTYFSIVSSSNKIINSVELFDFTGKALFKNLVNKEKVELSTDNLESGIYIVKIYYDDTFETKKLLVR